MGIGIHGAGSIPLVKWPGATAALGGACGLLVQDTFTDSNDVLLHNHTPDVDVVGGGWNNINNVATIHTNACRVEPAEWNRGGTIETGYADVYASVYIYFYDTDMDEEYASGIILRWTDSDNYWLVGPWANGELMGFGLFEVNAGVRTRRDVAWVSVWSGPWFHIEAWTDGQSIVGRWNDSGNLVSYSSAALNETVTEHGFMIQQDTKTIADDFDVYCYAAGEVAWPGP